ncbi:MAG TPA: hypothetical protein VHZ55_00875 [Bryobacteraceae bacterium]|jgi:hypothetical protein|nr:hypothetical protein [Bryobacteraceae bacterium]
MFQKADLEDADRFLEICRFMVTGLTEMESALFPSVDWQPVIECIITDPFVQQQIYRVLEMILI